MDSYCVASGVCPGVPVNALAAGRLKVDRHAPVARAPRSIFDQGIDDLNSGDDLAGVQVFTEDMRSLDLLRRSND